jgi:hypothetical protein
MSLCALTISNPGHNVADPPMTLHEHSIVVVSKDQMASEIGGETVILGMTAGRYYGLDSVGGRIWQLIQAPIAVGDVTRTILNEYDVDAVRCEADLLVLLEKMHHAGLVEVRGASSP